LSKILFEFLWEYTFVYCQNTVAFCQNTVVFCHYTFVSSEHIVVCSSAGSAGPVYHISERNLSQWLHAEKLSG